MAIGTAAAIGLGLAGVGAGASALSSNAASRRAARTSADNNAENNALARDIYGQNRQIISPFVNRGNAAGSAINALLGLGGGMDTNGMATMTMQPNALSQFQPRQSAASSWGLGEGPPMSAMGFGSGLSAMGGMESNGLGRAYLTANPDVADEFQRFGTQFNNDSMPGMQAAQAPAMSAREAADQGFELFKRSSGFQNRLNSALDSVTGAYSGVGAFQSGAAAKALQDRAGQVAGDEFANYMNALGAQQAVGAGSASALAGVGQNFAGTVMGNNNFNAQNQMAARLGQQNALGNVAGILGGGLLSFGMGGTRR